MTSYITSIKDLTNLPGSHKHYCSQRSSRQQSTMPYSSAGTRKRVKCTRYREFDHQLDNMAIFLDMFQQCILSLPTSIIITILIPLGFLCLLLYVAVVLVSENYLYISFLASLRITNAPMKRRELLCNNALKDQPIRIFCIYFEPRTWQQSCLFRNWPYNT
jgi:hypothetical protein